MNFYKMLDIIQSKNEGRIVLCDLGCFYITSGSNALLLNKLLKLKLICQEPGVCKVGFPKSSLEKYTKYYVLNCCEAAMDRINRKSKIIEII